MKIKIVLPVIICFLLFSCTPETPTQETEVINDVVIEESYTEPSIAINPPTEAPTETPSAQFVISSTTPIPPDVNSGYHVSFDGLSLYCDLGYMAGNSFLQVLPYSCTIDGVPNQLLPSFYQSTQWLRVDQPTGMPGDLATFPESFFSGYILMPSSVSLNRGISHWGINVAGDNGAANFAAVKIESGEHAGEIVLVNLISKGIKPTYLPNSNNGNDSENNNITPSTDPPPPTEEPHDGDDDPPEPTDVPFG